MSISRVTNAEDNNVDNKDDNKEKVIYVYTSAYTKRSIAVLLSSRATKLIARFIIRLLS